MNQQANTTEIRALAKSEESYKQLVKLQKLLISIATELLHALHNKEMNYSKSHLNMIAIVLNEVEPFCQDQKVLSLPVSYTAMHTNIKWTIHKISELIEEVEDLKIEADDLTNETNVLITEADDIISEAEDLTEFQLIPFLKEWKEDTYFWLLIFPDEKKMKQYYEHEFIPNHRNTYESRGEKYLVSIFIPVYNKVEYTKKCLESLFRNTDLSKHACELILLNDGSTDGTEDYFRELGVRKVLTLKENVKTMIFSLMYRVCEGKYAAFVNNDTILTNNWLDNLLTCIKSDSSIISVAPSTPNTSNLQGMIADFTPENAEEQAKIHNTTSPYLWEERCRLMPVIALYDMNKVDTIGFADRYFYTMEFWDDDFSLRARRAGYKQILCRDTWCYHFGSVSGREDQLKYRTLQNGRNLFIQKHHVDPWGNNFIYDLYMLNQLETTFPGQPVDIPVLGVDPGFGADVIQLKTRLKRLGKNVTFSFAISDPNVIEDLNPLDGEISLPESMLELHNHIPEGSYQYICIERELSVYPDYAELLTECASRLRTGGVLAFYVNNPYSLHLKKDLEEERLLNGKCSMTLISITELDSILKGLGLTTRIDGILEPNLPAELNKNRSEHLDRYFVLATKEK